MEVSRTQLPGVIVLTPKVFTDERGFFAEVWHQARYLDAGIRETFVQENVSRSARNVIRGLHFQNPRAQAKFVSVLEGEVYDVAVDIRVGSPTFGRATGVVLSAENHRQVYIPAGFAHGFCVTSESALFAYKCSDYYAPQSEWGIAWNDPDLEIDWPVASPVISEKDQTHPRLRQIERSKLPLYDLGAARLVG
ncbi:MAG TPA: dTDP-4-dehydrorhamnose 3,5-epimerase [Polyangiaceae bacterium]|nr:dTDP-4-dehydrorhamnose 3,5-epimerase [Polyangiaceae bacterium]